jgi:hypothetical protein
MNAGTSAHQQFPARRRMAHANRKPHPGHVASAGSLTRTVWANSESPRDDGQPSGDGRSLLGDSIGPRYCLETSRIPTGRQELSFILREADPKRTKLCGCADRSELSVGRRLAGSAGGRGLLRHPEQVTELHKEAIGHPAQWVEVEPIGLRQVVSVSDERDRARNGLVGEEG